LSWTIYIGIHVKRLVQGVSVAGYASTLEQAKADFRAVSDSLIEAGAIALAEG
jgi:hypothetical protein